MNWDPSKIECWSRGLGMASSPLFSSTGAHEGPHTVFLDGHASSFALSVSDDPDLVHAPQPLSWTWSANIRHLLVLNSSYDLFLRQWNMPSELQRLRVPRSASEADELVQKLAKFRRPREASVVAKMIAAFKALRAILSSYQHTSNLDVIRVFNSMIALAETPDGMQELAKCSTIGDVAKVGLTASMDEPAVPYGNARIDDIIFSFIHCAPSGLETWDPGLLLRHASGELYQEAHFELERQAALQRSLFGEYEPNPSTHGTQQRDARLTPPELARTLVEQSLNRLNDKAAGWILDPASGSGVFLQEVLRALEAVGYTGSVRLAAIDRSAISIEITSFCMSRAIADAKRAGIQVEFKIQECDALTVDWESPIAVLMNPPFASYKDMDDTDRMTTKQVLGDSLAVGHYDKSMAFVWKAVKSVAPMGVVASVLPSSLLDSNHGERWRGALLERADLCCVGRFDSYSYFPDAMVSPAFVVLQSPRSHSQKPVTIVAADEGHEEIAMRVLRKGESVAGGLDTGIFVSFDCDSMQATSATWMPKSFRYAALLDALRLRMGTVDDLFDVNQGALTGKNDVFILTQQELQALSKRERKYFRPAASTNTIRKGALLRREYVFYPYGLLSIDTEADLREHVPEYYKSIVPYKESLASRRGKQDAWWTLTEYRAWQIETKPKIVSAYFGASGNFAFDDVGDFVCLHGYAWNWSGPASIDYPDDLPVDHPEDLAHEDEGISFYGTSLPYAYTALLNSKPFELLLSCFCTRVAGGQFNLSKRFVRHIPLPDLASDVAGDIVQGLADLGETFGEQPIDHDKLSNYVALAYGVPLAMWGLERLRK